MLDIEVPHGLDIAAVKRAAQDAISDLQYNATRKKLCRSALTSDTALKRFLREIYHGKIPPVVRAGCYKTVPYYCEIRGWDFINFDHDERRPVIQKGSLGARYFSHSLSYGGSSPNGWCGAVMKRYLRRVRYTCLYWSEQEAAFSWYGVREAEKKIFQRHRPYIPKGWGLPYMHERDGKAWLNGKSLYITEHQREYIHKLLITVKKIENQSTVL